MRLIFFLKQSDLLQKSDDEEDEPKQFEVKQSDLVPENEQIKDHLKKILFFWDPFYGMRTI